MRRKLIEEDDLGVGSIDPTLDGTPDDTAGDGDTSGLDMADDTADDIEEPYPDDAAGWAQIFSDMGYLTSVEGETFEVSFEGEEDDDLPEDDEFAALANELGTDALNWDYDENLGRWVLDVDLSEDGEDDPDDPEDPDGLNDMENDFPPDAGDPSGEWSGGGDENIAALAAPGDSQLIDYANETYQVILSPEREPLRESIVRKYNDLKRLDEDMAIKWLRGIASKDEAGLIHQVKPKQTERKLFLRASRLLAQMVPASSSRNLRLTVTIERYQDNRFLVFSILPSSTDPEAGFTQEEAALVASLTRRVDKIPVLLHLTSNGKPTRRDWDVDNSGANKWVPIEGELAPTPEVDSDPNAPTARIPNTIGR